MSAKNDSDLNFTMGLLSLMYQQTLGPKKKLNLNIIDVKRHKDKCERAIYDESSVTLYQRYKNIVVHDTTQSTSKFKMAMHNFVVVDSAFRTRPVASALTSGKKIQDYCWVLQQLLAAGGGSPGGIMIDKDLAMETACERMLLTTRVYNCVWHTSRNRYLQLHKTLGGRWNAFERCLMTAARSLTPPEFDANCDTLFSTYGDNPKVRGYLSKIYEDRSRWAWP
ncbi:hypothetical protein EC991_010687, partial [Linnemannia zychae]